MQPIQPKQILIITSMLLMIIVLPGLTGCAGDRPNNLGVRNGFLAACPSSPNCVSSKANDETHSIAPILFNGNPDAAFARLKLLLEQRDDTTVIETTPGYLRVELRTILFVDDGEFLLDTANNAIQIRSASRIGYSDFGKNRSRIEEIRRQFMEASKN